jgi:hypothetical protein
MEQRVMYGSDAVEFMRSQVEGRQVDFILALTAAVVLIFILMLIAVIRGRRLRKGVGELRESVRKLIRDEEARYTREILGRTKVKDHG